MESKTVYIDNYSISEVEPYEYHIRKNGTPVAVYEIPRGMTSIGMKEFLLDYIARVTGESLGGNYDTK